MRLSNLIFWSVQAIHLLNICLSLFIGSSVCLGSLHFSARFSLTSEDCFLGNMKSSHCLFMRKKNSRKLLFICKIEVFFRPCSLSKGSHYMQVSAIISCLVELILRNFDCVWWQVTGPFVWRICGIDEYFFVTDQF